MSLRHGAHMSSNPVDPVHLKSRLSRCVKSVVLGVVPVFFAFAALGVVMWDVGRPLHMRRWDHHAIVATFAGMEVTMRQPVVFSFRYRVENRTRADYEFPRVGSLYRVSAGAKRLERDPTVKWESSRTIPAGRKVNIRIQVEYRYEGTPALNREFHAFANRRLAELTGFAAIDPIAMYAIGFPTPASVELRPTRRDDLWAALGAEAAPVLSE